MSMIETILKYVQKTNPDMTKEKLLEELSKSRSSASSIVFLANASKKGSC